MKRTFFTLALISTVLVLSAQPAKSYKRGVSENQFTYEAEIHSLSPGVTWFYNWGNTPNWQVQNVVGPDTEMEYVPMTWTANFNETNLRNYLAEHPGVKYLLGYNEPNFSSQANLTPEVAAQQWPIVEQIARDFNLKLVAPALNYSGQALSDGVVYQPEDWMDAFLAAYPEAHFDYLALHCYMNSASAQKGFVENFAKKYGKQVWLTEFCSWEGNVDSISQQHAMVQKVRDLELSPYVYRYAWFKARGTESVPYYRLLYIPKLSGGPEPGTLTNAGKIYTYMSSFDTTYYYTPDVVIPATNYVNNSDGVYLEVNNDSESDLPLQISNFDVYASVDYLVEIPSEGKYTLQLRLSSRKFLFDPKLRLEVDGETVVEQVLPSTITSGTADNWKTQEITGITMPAGRHRITLKSRQSTTCKVGWLKFIPETAIIGDVTGDRIVDVEDVNAAINIILKVKTSDDYPGSAEITGDGVIDVEDVNAIINIILNAA